MADHWFEIASIDHFWIRRRFEVLRRLAGPMIAGAREIAEIGCGHGLLQLQIENSFHREVTGFDLNEVALKKNLSSLGSICCYDIYQKDPRLRERFDLILLFDVLEHIDDESRFLTALLFHLAPKGKLIVNVPAGQWAYSAYDQAAGHHRRYAIHSLREVARHNNLEVTAWSYWGLPLLPILLLRKLWLLGCHDEGKIISSGFDSRNGFINHLLGLVSQCEPIPQKILGTSLMTVFGIGEDSQRRF